ncbi:MAG TPA: hypothetical protein VMZ52_12355 [Bryobacteraceae bacterium]|nr:hypothetical protein [Bryobacteraceae bacterium]
MDHFPEGEVSSPLKSAIDDARASAAEQVTAAWQLHVDRIREQLDTGWREQLEEIFQERFAEIEGRLQQDLAAQVDHRTQQHVERSVGLARTSARRELTEHLNHLARRLKHSESRPIWIRTLLDATQNFCGRGALFAVNGKNLKFEAGNGLSGAVEIPLASAPAFANAVESRDTVVAMASRRELSEAIAALAGESADKKIYLFPMVLRQTVVAVLYAEPGDDLMDVSALELLTSLAVNSMEVEVVTLKTGAADLVRIAGGEQQVSPAGKPSAWSLLSKSEQETHLKAQRFARTEVAQVLLYKVKKVKAGRLQGSLYATLKEEIDAGREAFRQQFMSSCPSMVDYYHLELVRTLANEDNSLLGAGYPGPLP